jgi:nicotinamidase-related amidase
MLSRFSSFFSLIGRCLEAKGAEFVRPLLPNSEDYFVLKPMHSEFYMTPLEVLLRHLQVETLILTGLTSISCITVTAHDANMRGFEIYVSSDCSCARNRAEHRQALAQLKATLASILPVRRRFSFDISLGLLSWFSGKIQTISPRLSS